LAATVNQSVRVPAESVLHIFKPTRPGQVRAPSWFSSVILKMKDLDEYEDATLMKQKIAACLAVITSDVDGSGLPLGIAETTNGQPIDMLEPGAIINTGAGRSVTVVDPPQNRDYDAYTATVLRAIATGLGVGFEDMAGNYTDMPFSATRMAKLEQQGRVHDWRWRLLIPQFCDPAYAWFVQAAAIMGQGRADSTAAWTPPPFAMVDPAAEGLAVQRNVRTGITSLSEEIRARGYDPAELLAEIAADNRRLDALGIVLDSDPRKMTQAGQLQSDPNAPPASPVSREMDRFVAFMRDLPDEQAVDILARMFGPKDARDAAREQVPAKDGA
jgi:lambda family phage portal protein